MRSIFSTGKYFHKSIKEGIKGVNNDAYRQARNIITKQRILSMVRSRTRQVRGGKKGYNDESFSVVLSRGFSTITPVKRKDFANIHQFGPFTIDSPRACFIQHSPVSYWKGRNVIFPLSISNTIAWFLNIIPDTIKKKMKDVNSVYCALPSYVGSFPTLTKFSEYNEGFKGKIDPRLLEVGEQIVRLKLPTGITKVIKKEVYHAKLTLETHPGVMTRHLAFHTKGGVFTNKQKIKKTNLVHYAVTCVLKSWDKISKGLYRNTCGVYAIGSREKIAVLDEGEILDTRPIFIPEICDLLVGSAWLEKLKDYWNADSLFSSEIWLGHADQDLRFHRRLELDRDFNYAYEFDGKKWDSSVCSPLIVQAFNIFRSCFEGGEDIDNHFSFIMETMILKKVVLHNGNTFMIDHGIPSGHAWTSHINSIVNWIIWTSTIHNCNKIPQNLKQDYKLQIHGDDIVLHCNELIEVNVRKEICQWMVENFNYKATDGTVEPNKSKVKHPDQGVGFLRRVIDSKGMIDMKTYDIWEKMLFGPEYSGLRHNRDTYFKRRMQDLTIFNRINSYRIAFYIHFMKHLQKFTIKEQREIYKVLFISTNGFTDDLRERWEIFSKITAFAINKLIKNVKDEVKYMRKRYFRNYFFFSSDHEYFDYWKERPKSFTITEILRNFDQIPLVPKENIMDILHYNGKVKRKRLRKRKYFKF